MQGFSIKLDDFVEICTCWVNLMANELGPHEIGKHHGTILAWRGGFQSTFQMLDSNLEVGPLVFTEVLKKSLLSQICLANEGGEFL